LLIANLPMTMNAPKNSIDGNCPKCQGHEWKLAKFLVMTGTTTVNSESDGGGFGLSAGLGRGHGGVGVNYQGVNLTTTGTHKSAAAIAYGPPDVPAEIGDVSSLLNECSHLALVASEEIKKIDEFATAKEGIRPGFLSGAGSDTQLKGYERKHAEICTRLRAEGVRIFV
jgi:hypothetical protein